MPLTTNSIMVFASYEIQDGGVVLRFTCANPGAGMANDWYILLTDAEIAGATNQAQLRTLVTDKLNRKFRAAGGISTRLDPFIGQSVTI